MKKYAKIFLTGLCFTATIQPSDNLIVALELANLLKPGSKKEENSKEETAPSNEKMRIDKIKELVTLDSDGQALFPESLAQKNLILGILNLLPKDMQIHLASENNEEKPVLVSNLITAIKNDIKEAKEIHDKTAEKSIKPAVQEYVKDFKERQDKTINKIEAMITLNQNSEAMFPEALNRKTELHNLLKKLSPEKRIKLKNNADKTSTSSVLNLQRELITAMKKQIQNNFRTWNNRTNVPNFTRDDNQEVIKKALESLDPETTFLFTRNNFQITAQRLIELIDPQI